ncbi:MAG TPA: hypothetical protein VGR35_15040 [Tepidisphaeraceae bacterium]|nr:hypothetical protein [Tepidisphaeraceae bacterium]
MKAERRHELQQNTLDQALTRAPEVARRYGGMILLIVLAAVVGYTLIRYRISSAREGERIAMENLATARTTINELSQLHLYPIPPQQMLEFRKRWADDARLAIDSITESASDPKLLAEALLARGDLNWALAQMKEPPAAATQPALRLETDQKTLLSEAESAYLEVVNQYADQKRAVVAARFGLAAISENRGEWDKARQMYEQITNDEAIAEAFRQQARIRLEQATEWSRPVLIAAATQPAAPTGVPFLNSADASMRTTAPTAAAAVTTTQPATTAPATTAPATQPLER